MTPNKGKHRQEPIQSRASIELMTTDHLMPEHEAEAGFFLGENRGWAFGVPLVTRRHEVAGAPGRYGWDGS